MSYFVSFFQLYIINFVDMGDIFSMTGDEVHLIKELPDSFRQLPMLALNMQLAGNVLRNH